MKRLIFILSIVFVSFSATADEWRSSDGSTVISSAECSEGLAQNLLFNNGDRDEVIFAKFLGLNSYYKEANQGLSCSDVKKWATSASALSLGFRIASRVAVCVGAAPVAVTFEVASYGTAALAIYIGVQDCEKTDRMSDEQFKAKVRDAVQDYLNFSEPQKLYTPVDWTVGNQI